MKRASQREIKRLIYLSGIGGDYQVHHNIPGEAIICHVPNVSLGNVIVRALRRRAQHGDLTTYTTEGGDRDERLRTTD
jgi:hypothetical protein